MNGARISRGDILQVIFASIDEVNAQLGSDQQVAKATDTWLLVGTNGLDSLAYVNLITAIEEKCEDRFGRFVPLSGSDVDSGSYDTIGELAEYVLARLGR